jgi:hypothetical protein
MGPRSLRVLQICGSLTPMACGIGDYTAHLADALGRMDSVTAGVITSAEVPSGEQGAFEVMPVVPQWTARAVPSIVSAVRRWKPDVVHMQFPARGYGKHYGPWLVPFTLALQGFPLVQTWHEYYPAGSGWRNILNALTPGGLIAVRPNYLDQMPSWYRRVVSRKRFKMIPNAAALPAMSLTEEERMAIREKLGVRSRKLVAFFGFVYPAKGTSQVFDIASPKRDHVVVISELNRDNPYHHHIWQRIESEEWRGHAVVTGFLPEREAAAILAAADAVVLPFTEGGGVWNTSVHASAKQGTFVLTTASDHHGLDAEHNIYRAAPGDLDALRLALDEHIGQRVPQAADSRAAEWRGIAEMHLQLYHEVLGTV